MEDAQRLPRYQKLVLTGVSVTRRNDDIRQAILAWARREPS